MLTQVRTTVVIEDDLLRRARLRAAELDTTLSSLISQALREALTPKPRPAAGRFAIPTYGNPKRPVRHEPADLARFLDEEDIAGLRR